MVSSIMQDYGIVKPEDCSDAVTQKQDQARETDLLYIPLFESN